MKTKRKTILFSSILICLFIASLTTQAAVDPIMTVDFEPEYYEKDLPIKVNVLFTWASGSAQRLEYVYLDYNVNSKVIDGSFRLTYDWDDVVANARPTKVTLGIPSLVARANDTVWFKISYVWHTLWGNDILEAPTEKYKIDILYEGQKKAEQGDMTLYIVLGGAAAVVLIALAVIYTRKRRR